MEKLRFAIQVVALTLALPVYFYAELNHDTKQAKQSVKEKAAIEVNYTKNGRDRTQVESSDETCNSNPVYTHSFN